MGYQATLIAFSSIGCQDSVSVPINYQEELIYYIPNSFTPDADEHNQTFKPIFTSGFDPFNYEISIYNRWGEMIWKSFDHTQGWDGAYSANQGIPVQEGQYSWVIKFKPRDTDGKVIIHGIVNVLK
jgi:gliding motility-associated-like protein